MTRPRATRAKPKAKAVAKVSAAPPRAKSSKAQPPAKAPEARNTVTMSAAAEVKPRRRRRTAPAGIAPSEPERDILDQYLYEVSTYPLLQGTEEIEVARRIRAGDPDALQELVKRNLRFVIFRRQKYQNRGLPLIDLIGEGNVGLLTAARRVLIQTRA